MSQHSLRILALCVLASFFPLVQAQAAPGNGSPMTAAEARIALRKSLIAQRVGAHKGCDEKIYGYRLAPMQDFAISSEGFQFFDRGAIVDMAVSFFTGKVQDRPFEATRVFKFEASPRLSVIECKTKGEFSVLWGQEKKWHDRGIYSWANATDAQMFADAVNLLTFEYRGGDLAKEAAEFEAFKAKAKSWRESSAKPELPGEARREKVLAEEAIREKDLELAISHYETGLKSAPLWPQVQFNLALLNGEFGDYFAAVRHMRRYLELVPEAPDAQAARDKLIVWEDKAQQRQQRVPQP